MSVCRHQPPAWPQFAAIAAVAVALVTACANPVPAQPPQGTEHFVPADQLDTVFDGTSGVLLPGAEYRELLQKAEAARLSQSEQPAEILIRSANYRVQLSDNQTLVQLTLDVEQFSDGWQRLDIPAGNLQLERALAGETPATVGRPSATQLHLFHQAAGRFTVELSFSTAQGRIGSDRAAAFHLIRDVPVRLTADCPAGQHLLLDGRRLQRAEPVDQPTTYTVPVGLHRKLNLRWTTRRNDAETDTLVFVRSDSRIQLSSDTLRWQTTSRLSVFGGQISQLTAAVPASLEITAVESTGLESWELSDDSDRPGQTRMTLTWRQPFDADRLISISGVAPLVTGEPADIPPLIYNEVTAHTGRLRITQKEELRLTAVTGDGIRQLASQTDDQADESSPVFDYWLQDYRLSVAVRPRDRELFSQTTSTLNITDSLATLTVGVVMETLNAPLFEAQLKTPEGWQIVSVTDASGQPVTWRLHSSDSSMIVEPATPVAPGRLFLVNLTLTHPIADPTSAQQLNLPIIGTPGAPMVGGRYTISSTPDLQIAPTEISGLVPTGEESANIVFEAQGTTMSGRLNIVRRPARLSSRAEIRCHMDARQKTVTARITIDVINGTTRQLQIRLPEDTGEDLRFHVTRIGPVPGYESTEMNQLVPQQIQLVEAKADDPVDGSRLWHLTFDRRFAGSVSLITQIQQPRSDESQLAAPTLEVPQAIHQEGLIAFEASPDQQFDESDSRPVRALRPADPSLVTAPSPSTGRRIARVYQFVRPDYDVTLTETRYDTQPVPTAVCKSVENTSLLSDSGSIRRSCRVELQCVGVQTLRFTLPDAENSFLWSTVLNEEAVEVRRDNDDYLVSIPTGDQRTEHELELLFETQAAAGPAFAATQQEPVRFAIDVDSSQSTPVDVLKQLWIIMHPSSTMLLDHEGSFEPLRSPRQPGWLQSLSNKLSVPSLRLFGARGLAAAVILGSILLIGVLTLRRRYRTAQLLTVTAATLFVAWLMMIPMGFVRYDARDGHATSVTMVASDSGLLYEDIDGDGMVQESAEGKYSAGIADEQRSEPQLQVQGGIDLQEGDSSGSFSGNGADGIRIRLPTDSPTQQLFGGELGGIVPESPEDFSSDFAGGRVMLGVPYFADGEEGGGGGGGFGGGGHASPEESEAETAAGSIAVQQSPRRGSARLSVQVDLEEPDGYRTAVFLSLGADSGPLSLVMQTVRQINALRLLAAALTLLICWLVHRRAPAVKLAAMTTLMLAAIAFVPLAPGQWQAALDGIVLGTLLAILLWPVTRMVNWIQNGCCRRRTVSLAGLTLLLLAIPASAAEDQSSEASAPDTPPAEAAAEPSSPKVVRPYTPGEPPLTADQVFVPRKEFLKLYELAFPGELQSASGPTDALVTAAFFTGGDRQQVQGNTWTQRFKARIVVRTFHDRSTQVTLPFRQAALHSAQLNGQDAVITRADDAFQLHVARAGLHVLDAEFDITATIDASGGRMTVHLKEVPAGLLTFELPSENLNVQINGSSSRFRQEETTIHVPLASQEQLRIAWQPDTTRGSTDTIVHSTLNSTLEINDQGLTLIAAGSLNCRQGSISQAELTLPAGYSVRTVEGKDVAGWTVAGSEEAPRLKVVFRAEISSKTSLRITLFSRQVISEERQSFAVPILEPLSVSRSTGTICVLAGKELEIQTESLSGVSQINPGDADLNGHQSKATRPVLAWRYNRHPAEIAVRVFRITDRMTATVLSAVQLEAERQRWTSALTASIQGAPRQRLDIRIPAAFLAVEVDCSGLADWYVTEPSDSNQAYKTLSIQLQSAVTGRIHVVMQGQNERSADRQQEQLATPYLIDADEQTTELSIWQAVATDISGFDGDGWSRVDQESTSRELQSLRPDAAGISLTNRNTQPSPVTLRLRRASASATCESVTVTNVTSTSIELTLALTWRIARSAADTFSVELPAAIADALDFQIAGLRQEQRTPLDDDQVRITFHLQYPVSERFFVAGRGAIPLPTSGEFRSIPLTFAANSSERSPLSVASQAHYWVIVNQSDGLLEAVRPEVDTEDIAPDQLETKLPAGFLSQSVAIRRITDQQPGSDWHIRFPETQQTVPAVIALAQHVTVLAEDGSWRSRHTLQVRNESRQFLPIRLPENSRPLFCLVSNRPTRLVTRTTDDGMLHLIPIPPSGAVSAPFEVQFGLEGRLPDMPSAQGGWQSHTVAIPLPVFPEYRDNSDLGVTVARNTWNVYVPDAWSSAMNNDPRLTNVVPADAALLEDTVVKSTVETGRELLQQARQAKDKLTRDRLVGELSSQLDGLKAQRANTAGAEEDRASTLKEIEVYVEGNTITSNSRFDSGSNAILDARAYQRNSFNDLNNNDLITSNGGSGIQFQQGSFELSAPQFGVPSFGFTLEGVMPENWKRSSGRRSSSPESGKALSKQSQSRGRRSQLFEKNLPDLNSVEERRPGLMREQLSDPRRPRGQGMDEDRSSQSESAQFNHFHTPAEVRHLQQAPNAAGQTVDQIEFNYFSQAGAGPPESDAAPAVSNDVPAAPPVSTGLLSLRMAIPTGGQQLDFVRGSGNAALTLEIRPASSWRWFAGILWAIACFIAWQLLVRALRSGRTAQSGGRYAAVVCLIGLAGWFLLSSPLSILAILCATAGAVAFCIFRIRCRRLESQPAEA